MIPYFELPTFHLGPFTLQAFGLFAAAGVYLAARLVTRAAEREGLDTRPLLDFALWGVLSGVVFGHLVHLLLYHPEELREPLRIVQIWEGLSSFGGLLGGILAAVVFFHRRGIRFHDYGDAFALGVAPGWAVARVGCFVVHDHPGIHTTFPLAVAFPDGPRHDLGLYDAILLFAITAVLYALAHRRVLEGRLLAMLALLYAPARFYFDFLRGRPGDVAYPDARYLGLTPAQYGCILLVAYAVWQLGTVRGRKGAEEQPIPSPSGRGLG